jgi:hypothetical protein
MYKQVFWCFRIFSFKFFLTSMHFLTLWLSFSLSFTWVSSNFACKWNGNFVVCRKHLFISLSSVGNRLLALGHQMMMMMRRFSQQQNVECCVCCCENSNIMLLAIFISLPQVPHKWTFNECLIIFRSWLRIKRKKNYFWKNCAIVQSVSFNNCCRCDCP